MVRRDAGQCLSTEAGVLCTGLRFVLLCRVFLRRRLPGQWRMVGRLMKLEIALATFVSAALGAASPASAQPAKAERIAIEYLDPANSAHVPLYEVLKANQVLERVKELLTRVSWPRTLWLTLKGCDGESNAWYVDARVVVCYEYLEDMWRVLTRPDARLAFRGRMRSSAPLSTCSFTKPVTLFLICSKFRCWGGRKMRPIRSRHTICCSFRRSRSAGSFWAAPTATQAN